MDELKIKILETMLERSRHDLSSTPVELAEIFNPAKVHIVLEELSSDGFVLIKDGDKNYITPAGRNFLAKENREHKNFDLALETYEVSAKTLKVLLATCLCTAVSAFAAALGCVISLMALWNNV